MTKENRTNVSAQINTVEDLKPGDKVVVKYRKGLQIETKLTYVFGCIQGGIIKTEGYDDVMGKELFNVLVPGYDSAVTTVWRKVEPLPSTKGTIIYVSELRDSVAAGFFINRSNGSWQSVLQPDLRITSNQIVAWQYATLDTIN